MPWWCCSRTSGRGNVRQLRNNVERVMILAGGDLRRSLRPICCRRTWVRWCRRCRPKQRRTHHGAAAARGAGGSERDYLIAQISRFSGNISRTAEFVGMERSAWHRKLKALRGWLAARPIALPKSAISRAMHAVALEYSSFPHPLTESSWFLRVTRGSLSHHQRVPSNPSVAPTGGDLRVGRRPGKLRRKGSNRY